jgi:hypothetical protein
MIDENLSVFYPVPGKDVIFCKEYHYLSVIHKWNKYKTLFQEI